MIGQKLRHLRKKELKKELELLVVFKHRDSPGYKKICLIRQCLALLFALKYKVPCKKHFS